MANSWQKAFSRIFWRNRDKGAPYTPLGESKLLPMDASIDEMDDRIVTLRQTKAEQSDFLTSISGITFDRTTGIFTVTKFNGTSFTIDTDLEKVATNFDYDDDPTSAHYQQLILTLVDGTVKYVDLSALLTQYEFTDTSTIHFAVVNGDVAANVINGSITESHLAPSVMATINQKTAQAGTYADESEAWARGTIDGEPIQSTDPEYHNNSKYYSEVADESAEDSEAWAKGTRNGSDVPSTDETYHNNSKYYSEQAAQAAASIPTKLSGFTNDCGFIDNTVNDLVNYYTKNQTFTKAEVNALLADKVDKVTGKQLSTEDFTTTLKNKLAGIQAGAEANVQSDWNQTNTAADDYIKNKPTIPTKTVFYGTCTGQAANQVKAVTVSNEQDFELKAGLLLSVKFDANNTYSATAENPVKLNVNNTGAKQIYGGNTATPTGTNTTFFGRLNYYNYYVYDGTYWVWAGSSADNNTIYTPQTLGFGYATCSTAAATAAKVATLSGYSLVTNGIVSVKFTNSVPANATLNINNRGAKNIYYKGAKIVAGVIKAGDIATFVYSGNYNLICIDRGSNGHIIVDSSGSQLASENSLQFADSHVTDDSANGRTVVENVKEVTLAELSQATERGMYLATDEESVPIGASSEDKVEVTADGNKTYTQLLTELKSGIDKTKLQYYSEIVLDKQTSVEIHDIVYWDANVVVTACVFTTYGGVTETDTFYIGKNVKYQKNIVGNVTDMSSEKPSNGTKITLYYGTSSGIVELNTDARHCMMSDGVTSVESAIDDVAENINNLITTDTFTATLTVGDNLLRFNGSATSKVTSGNMPTNNKFIVVPINMGTSNIAMLSVHLDGGYSDIHCNTDMAQTVTFRWYQFNI